MGKLNDEKDEMLDLVSKVQMFQIAVKKINNNEIFDPVKEPVQTEHLDYSAV